jgi:hypothetical protein
MKYKMPLIGYDYDNTPMNAADGLVGGRMPAKKHTKKPHTNAGRSTRGEMVSKLMKAHGMSLGQASKYIKEHKMY